MCFFFECYGSHPDLHVFTPSFPTRLSSDLDEAGTRVRRQPRIEASYMYRRLEHPPPPSPATILPLQVPKQISNVAICRFTRQRPQVFKILRRHQAPEHIPDEIGRAHV